MTNKNSISLVIPLFNEQEMLPRLIQEIESFKKVQPAIEQVILVDDGCTDDSAGLVKDLVADLDGYTLIRFSRNFGQQLAIAAGLRAVTTDAAVVLDADLQDPLETINGMVAQWRSGYEVVYGVRRTRKPDSILKRNGSAFFYKVFSRMTSISAPENAGDFRLIGRKALDVFNSLGEHQPYVRGLTSWMGFEQIGVEYDRQPREAGITKYPMRKMISLAINSITAFSDKPLKLAVRVGFGMSILAAAGLVWVVFLKLFTTSTIPGWASILFAILLFGGLQLFFLGIVGVYLARVYDEVKGRPRYILQEVWKSGARITTPIAEKTKLS